MRASATSWILAALVVACGARSPLPNGRDAGEPDDASIDVQDASDAALDVNDASDEDAASDAPEDAPIDAPLEPWDVTVDRPPPICADAGTTFIYLVSEGSDLWSFYPPLNRFQRIGGFACPAPLGTSPFSMGVDHDGLGYVVFAPNGVLFNVTTADATCTRTTFVPGQQGFTTFGMGFSVDPDGLSERLYVAEWDYASGANASKGLASIDPLTLEFTFIGAFDPPLDGRGMELTGTGDGRLFGYSLSNSGQGGQVIEVDKSNAKILSSTPLNVGNSTSALAFAFWGGDFYLFTTSPARTTDVTRYRPSDGSVDVVGHLDRIIVGAGVSTCAPR